MQKLFESDDDNYDDEDDEVEYIKVKKKKKRIKKTFNHQKKAKKVQKGIIDYIYKVKRIRVPTDFQTRLMQKLLSTRRCIFFTINSTLMMFIERISNRLWYLKIC